MSRTVRQVLDITLLSLDKAKPIISKGWGTAKAYIMNSGARRLVDNKCVNILETKVESLSGILKCKLEEFRDRQLAKEIPYLEKELQNARSRLKVQEKK